MNKIDYGVDLNKDGHCDNCGWFVDQYGVHRARLIFEHTNEDFDVDWVDKDTHVESLSVDDLVSEYYDGEPYKEYNPSWDLIKTYSLNDVNNLYSCPSINNYLRFGRILNNADTQQIIKIAALMNEAIDRFVLKKTLVTYRGMSFNRDDSFVAMLDTAFVKLETQKVYPFVDKGFVSTSLSLEHAVTIAVSEKEVQVICSIINLPGSKAMPLSEKNNTTANDDEKEILLRSFEKYYICGVQKYSISNKIYYKVIIINSKEDIENVD